MTSRRQRLHAALLPKLDRLLDQMGLVRRSRVAEAFAFKGVFCITAHCRGRSIALPPAQNVLTYPTRILVARLLARTSAQTAATFMTGTEGTDADDPGFPAFLYIGTSNTSATPDDLRLGNYLTENETFPDAAAACLRFPVERIFVYDTKGDYDAIVRPIHVAFEFDIPVGTLRSGGDAESTPLLIREWGIHADDGGDDQPIQGNPAVPGEQVATASPPTLLARRSLDVTKLFELSLTVRWEFWT